jgi:hypothetical protein
MLIVNLLTLKPSEHFLFTTKSNIQKVLRSIKDRIHVICMALRANSDYFPV